MKSFIESDFPVKVVSEESAREKILKANNGRAPKVIDPFVCRFRIFWMPLLCMPSLPLGSFKKPGQHFPGYSDIPSLFVEQNP